MLEHPSPPRYDIAGIPVKLTTLQSLLLWIVLLVVAIAVALLVVKVRNRPEWGFKDVVKDPGYWKGVEEAQARVAEAASAAQQWDDDKVASATKRYILEAGSSRDAWEDARVLRALGERTQPAVLALLRDASLYNRLVKPTGVDVLPESPFHRACDLLGEVPPAEAVEVLAPFLNDPDDKIRKEAVLAIAKTGAPSITPLVRKAFLDEDEYVRAYALMGLRSASDGGRLAESVRGELFGDVQTLVRSGRDYDATDVLCSLDRKRAVEWFLSPEIFTAGSPTLPAALTALVNDGTLVPYERLKSLILSLEQQELKRPTTYALGSALHLLGRHQWPEDEKMLRGYMAHPEESIALGATNGLLAASGLGDYERRIWEKEEQSGQAALTDPQRYYSAVQACDAEINNGGISQYFVNSSGDQWPEALAGFQAMGLSGRAEILREAVAIFGKSGPSTNRPERQEQLSKLYNRDDEIFDALDSLYYKSPEVMSIRTVQYVLENADAFR